MPAVAPCVCVCDVQLYTVAKDGAVVVWECSFSLKEMNSYIAKVRERTRSFRKSEKEEEEEMDTSVSGVEQGEELQESSDESMYSNIS